MAILKSRQVLAERQASAQASNKIYQDTTTWQKMAMNHKRVVTSKSWVDWVQNPLGIAGGVVANTLQKAVTGEAIEGTSLEGISLSSGTLSYTKLWRYKLLMKGDNGMEKTQYSPRPSVGSLITDALPFIKSKEGDQANLHTTKTLSEAEKQYPGQEPQKIKSRRESKSFEPSGINYVQKTFEALEGLPKRRQNEVIIINQNVSPYQAITLQNRPNEISFDPKANWVPVASMGRNLPFMMYTGGEDTISFDISWFANDPAHRDEVLWKCRLLESWSRADGYMASPPLLNIKWGSSEVFKDTDYFILESARYTLKSFQDRSRKSLKGPHGEFKLSSYDSELIDLKLNPAYATQTLVFKRVAMENPTHEDIVPLGKLAGISGINLNYT